MHLARGRRDAMVKVDVDDTLCIGDVELSFRSKGKYNRQS